MKHLRNLNREGVLIFLQKTRQYELRWIDFCNSYFPTDLDSDS